VRLASLRDDPRTLVFFESPRRAAGLLRQIRATFGDRRTALCRELTKLHEEVARGTLGELARRFRDEARGEIVVVIGPAATATAGADIGFAVDALRRLVQSGARPRAAAGVVAALTGTRANDLYRGLTGRDPRQ
jgi:16S rRNA (cytidine1402-2'-O)-methyltransferase